MIFSGSSAIDQLALRIKQDDPVTSSHWRKYHSDFEFSNGNFKGLQGFGILEPPFTGFTMWKHLFFQKKFRRLGRAYQTFDMLDKSAASIAHQQERSYNLDFLRQTITLAFLKEKLPSVLGKDSVVWVIGDGFGSMSALLSVNTQVKCIVVINLTKTLLVDLWYIKKLYSEADFSKYVHLVTEGQDIYEVFEKMDDLTNPIIIAVEASKHIILDQFPASLVINIASMQEMDPVVTGAYFTHMRNASSSEKVFFYCCNREEKTLPDRTISRFSDYPWREGDIILVDELCPWHQKFYAFRPPYIFSYDGPIRHRLVQMKKTKE